MLVLHFDVNETLLLDDPAGGDTPEDCLNKIIAKSAFCRIPASAQLDKNVPLSSVVPTQWLDGSPILGSPEGNTKNVAGIRESEDQSRMSTNNKCPGLHTDWEWPEGACPYYKTAYKKFAKTFTEHHGSGYRQIAEQIKQNLTLGEVVDGSREVDERISHDGVNHFMLPAFFHCMHKVLTEEPRRKVRLVIRTFGSDLSNVANAITAFAEGNHPLYPDFRCPELVLKDENLYRGRWVPSQSVGVEDEESSPNGIVDDLQSVGLSHVYHLYKWNKDDTDYDTPVERMLGTCVARGDSEVLQVIEGANKSFDENGIAPIVCGIQDDYNFWASRDYAPHAGKPVWVQKGRAGVHHIFFDDNIHNNPDDSIVAIRSEIGDSTGLFRSLSGEEIIEMQGKHVVRVPTVEPCLNRKWFEQQIARCEANRQNFIDE